MKRGQLSREIILETAQQLAEAKGLEQLTYNGLAREVGIQPQSMYRYLSNLAAVRVGVVTSYLNQLVQTLTEETNALTGKAAIVQLGTGFIHHASEGLAFSDMLWGLSTYAEAPEVVASIAGLRDLIHGLTVEVTKDPAQVHANEMMLVNFLIGSLGLKVARGEDAERERLFEQNLKRMIQLF